MQLTKAEYNELRRLNKVEKYGQKQKLTLKEEQRARLLIRKMTLTPDLFVAYLARNGYNKDEVFKLINMGYDEFKELTGRTVDEVMTEAIMSLEEVSERDLNNDKKLEL